MILIGNLCVLYTFFPFPNGSLIYLVHPVFPPILDVGCFGWNEMYHVSMDMKPWGATLRPAQDDLNYLKILGLMLGALGHMNLDCLFV